MSETMHRDNGLLDLYFQEVSCAEPLSSEEEIRLAREIRTGNQEARNQLVSANLRFVIRVACEYRDCGVPLEDLISAGNVGLITAAERFDETRGYRFITYAVWWIRQAIHQSLSQDSRMIRLPANRVKLLHNIQGICRKLGQVQASEPDPEAIAGKLGVSVKLVEDTLIRAQDTWSLDAARSEEDEHDSLQILPDVRQVPPDVQLAEDSVRQQVQRVLKTLDDREAEVLRLLYGIDGQEPMTLQEIGGRFHVTKERVRQIKEKALSKLRHPRRRVHLDALLEVV